MFEHGSWDQHAISIWATYQEIPRLVSLLQQLVLNVQVAVIAEWVLNIDEDIRDGISRALNVKPFELCPMLRCPVRGPWLYWLSWKLTAVDHYSVERAKRVDTVFFSAV